jgi:hypothetical protein
MLGGNCVPAWSAVRKCGPKAAASVTIRRHISKNLKIFWSREFCHPSFFLALRVRVQVVTRPLPDGVQAVQGPAKRVFGHPLLRGDLQDLAE